jgi:gliding motility-associated-like protein
MTRSLYILLFLSMAVSSTSAQGVWTWIHGDSVTDPAVSKVIRGIKGVSSPTNFPPRDLWYGLNWKDSKDRFWIIGCLRQFKGLSTKDTTEVWSYNHYTNSWTWEAGYDTIYIDGSLPDSFLPILRKNIAYLGTPYWTDSLGNLWYFHEIVTNYTSCTLVIKFDISSRRFIVIDYRMNYSSYGIKGIASSTNWPLGRAFNAVWGVGNSAFVYGGRTSSFPNSNELWEYNMSTGFWTWHGGGATPGAYYYYGTKGVASSSNWPPGNDATTSKWVKGKKCYFVGGLDQQPSNGILSELWEYDVSTGLWTWLNGESRASPNHSGVYSGQPCIDSPGLFPSARRFGASVSTRICSNSLWYYSGIPHASKEFFNDLWLYKPLDNRWIWVYGKKNDTTYYYGQKGLSSLANKPPARNYAMMWSDNQDRLYLFGGWEYNIVKDSTGPYNYGLGNDLWRYDPDYSCINYSLSEKFIDRNVKYKICVGDSSVVKVRAGYDSIRVIPMTNVSIKGTSATGAEITLKPTTNNSYKIIAYGYRCESQLDSLTVPIVVSPPRTSSEAKTICYGASYMGKNTSGTYNFNYPDPLKCDSVHTLYLTVRPQNIKMIDSTVCEGVSVYGRSVSGSFRDTFTGSNSCDSIRQLNLTVIPKNQLIDTAICRGQSLAGYTAAGTYLDTLTSSQGCITYRTLRLGIREPSSSTHTQVICEGQSYWGHSTTGTHTDILTASNGCDSTRTLNLTVNKKSFFTLMKEICRGESYEGRNQAGTYLDTFRNAAGCDSIRTLVLTLRNPRIIKKLKDTAICRGSEAILDAGLGHRDYLWSTGELSPSILVKNEGEYKLSFTDTANCKGRDSAKVKYHNGAEIILQDEISNYKGELLLLNPQIKPSDVGGKYRWSPSHIFQCDSCRSARFKLDNSAVVRLEFTDAQGCKAYKDVKVNIYDSWAVGFPTAFSPNGDGTNDEYFPNVENILSYNIAIYNRWGEKVFSSNHLKQKWNGYYKGEAVPFGSYSYFAEVILLNQVRRTYTGTFHLVR